MFNWNAVSYTVQAYSGESGAEPIFLADFIGVFLRITKSDVVVVLFATWKTSTRLYIQTHWLKDVHTLGNARSQSDKKLLGNFNSSFCFSFIPLCMFFSVLWMVGSLGLYNCVYIIWVIYHLNFLSFCYFFWFVIALILYWRRAHVQSVCTWLSLKKMVLQSVQF